MRVLPAHPSSPVTAVTMGNRRCTMDMGGGAARIQGCELRPGSHSRCNIRIPRYECYVLIPGLSRRFAASRLRGVCVPIAQLVFKVHVLLLRPTVTITVAGWKKKIDFVAFLPFYQTSNNYTTNSIQFLNKIQIQNESFCQPSPGNCYT